MGNEYRKIADRDGDTYIDVESTPDGDLIIEHTGGTLRRTMSSAGERTLPTQPAFNAYPTSNQENIAVNSDVTVVLGSERFDQNDDFASNTFTAPVTGRYQLNVSLYIRNIPADAVYLYMKLVTTLKTYGTIFTINHALADHSLTLSILADMNDTNTAYVTLKQSAGTQQTDIDSGLTTFSGFLAC